MDIQAFIERQRAAFEAVKPVDQEIAFGGTVVTARLWPVNGREWRDLCAVHPPRVGSASDQQFGYNIDAVVAAYPKIGLVDGDDVDDLWTVDDAGARVYQWPVIAAELSAPDLKNLAIAAWGLNEYDPAKRAESAGKASTGGRQKKRRSPANSA